MAITLVGSHTSRGDTGTAISDTHGLTILTDDVIVCIVHANLDTNTITDNNAPNGMTKVLEDGGANTNFWAIFARRAPDNSEPASYAFTLGSSDRWKVQTRVYRGVHVSSMWDVQPLAANYDWAASGTTATAPTITTTYDGSMVIAAFFNDHTDDYTWSGVTNGFGNELEGGGNTEAMSTASYDKVQTTAGAVGATAATLSVSDDWLAIQFALRPAVWGGGGGGGGGSSSQKQVTVYSQTADGMLGSNHNTYATARTGANLWVHTSASAESCGQNIVGSAKYCYINYLMLDTSEIPVDVLSIDDVQVYVAVNKVFTTAATLQLRDYTWTPPLTTGQWIAGEDMAAAAPLLASLASGSMTESAYNEWTAEAGIEDWIVPGGITYGVICSDRFVSGTTPTTAEYGNVYHGESPTLAFKVVITYTSTDTSLSGGKSLVVRPFSHRAAAAQTVIGAADGLATWWFDGHVAKAEVLPTTTAEIPRSRWYIVGEDTPGVSVRYETKGEETPEIICVLYSALNESGVADGTIRRVYYPAAPTTAIQRVVMVPLTSQFMNAAQALLYATNLYNQAAVNGVKATVTVLGGLWTVDHHWVPAPLLQAGGWLDLVSEFGHTPVYITGSSYDPKTHTVILTTGGQEQREPIIPGWPGLPTAPSVYGGGTGDGSGADQDPGKKGTYDPGPTGKLLYKTETGVVVLSPGSSTPLRRI